MVTNPGKTPRPDQLRPLNPPVPVEVRIKAGRPVAILAGEQSFPVERVDDHWQVEDEWWREPVNRVYFRVILENGIILTLYHDEVTDHWYQQNY